MKKQPWSVLRLESTAILQRGVFYRFKLITQLFIITCVLGLIAVSGVARAATPSKTGTLVLGVACSDVYALGIDKQENLRAGLIRIGCGLEPGGEEVTGTTPGDFVQDAIDAVNVDTVNNEVPADYPHVTQSESMVWASPDGNTIVVNMNDSKTAGGNYSGVSVSTNGGGTFNRLLPAPFATGHGTNFGDPIVVFNIRLNKWFAGDLASGCGPGLGIGLWTSTDGLSWTVGACAHNGSGGGDDRESFWVDNNASSPFFGRMYISWNNFALATANIFVTYSDDGVAWSAPVQVSATFIRNIQLTGSLESDGTVFIAGMDEHGGGATGATRTNYIYRSTTGGTSWTPAIRMGPDFNGPGIHSDTGPCAGYFWAVPPIWRHMGWGQPAAGPSGVVHYAYAGRGLNAGDAGDIFYTRSLDNGSTWTTPIVLNSDQATGGTRTQWMPSVSVTPTGQVEVTWYDRRNSTDGTNYEYFGISSPDNGASFGADAAISDVLIQQPEQPDSAVQGCYAGDYNYQTATTTTTLVTWADGRNPISGHFQQDVYFAAVAQGGPTGGTLQGTVTDSTTTNPIAGAQVQAVGPVTRVTTTAPDGTYHLTSVPAGSYNVTVTAFGYLPGSASGVVVVDGLTTTQDFALTLGPAHSVSGTVTASDTLLPISGAQVTILSTPIPPATTDTNGMYSFSSVPEGTYNIQATASGYGPATQSVTVNMDVIVNFTLDPTVAPCPPSGIDDPSQCDAVAGNLVANCGFETGNFPPWVQSGDLGFTSLDAASAHSGNLGLDIGPTGGLGFIAQNLATTTGNRYALRFWLQNLSGAPNRFQVSWGGNVIFDTSDQGAFPYTQYCWSGIAPSDVTELKFGFQQPPSFFHFDDVVVTPQ